MRPPEVPRGARRAVCTALNAVTKLISADLITAVLAPVVQLLGHPRELVRKKAVAVLHRFEQLDPQHEGPLAGADVDAHLRRMLCDKASTSAVRRGNRL